MVKTILPDLINMGIESDKIGYVEYKTRVDYKVMLKHAKTISDYLLRDPTGFELSVTKGIGETDGERDIFPYPLKELKLASDEVMAQMDGRESCINTIEHRVASPEYCNIEYCKQNDSIEEITLTFVSSKNAPNWEHPQPHSQEQNGKSYLRLQLTHKLPIPGRKKLLEQMELAVGHTTENVEYYPL